MADDDKKIPTDKDMSKRNRLGRMIVAVVLPLLIVITSSVTVNSFISFLFQGIGSNQQLVGWIGGSLGLGLGLLAGGLLFFRLCLVTVDPNRLFLTQDLLAGLLGKEVDVVYGPGLHFSYPWERRLESGNISLEEATVKFTFDIMLPDGKLTGNAAYWLRADHKQPIRFLRSVASVGEELQTLIVAEIQNKFGDDAFRESITTTDTSKVVMLLNEHLKSSFIGVGHEMEENNGIIITNAAVERLLPSEELQKSLSAVSEARAVRLAAAELLGIKPDEIGQAIRDGRITQEQLSEATRKAMSISGNLEGMELKRWEFGLTGVTPEIAQVIGDIAKTPAAVAFASGAGRKQPSSGKGKK